MLALSQACCRSHIRVGMWIYEHSPVDSSTAFLDMPRKWDSTAYNPYSLLSPAKCFMHYLMWLWRLHIGFLARLKIVWLLQDGM